MSDIDDLLNYDENELGDVDLDANEDELLLSDEETSPTKSSTTWETKSPVSSERSLQPSTQTDNTDCREQVDSSTHVVSAPETEVTTTDDQLETSSVECQSQKNGEVSSTIKDTVESTPTKIEQASQESEEPQSQETTDITSEYPSSETGTATGTDDVIDLDYSYTDGDVEDSDGPGERRNPKTVAERESMASDSDDHQFRHDRNMRGFPRGRRGTMRGMPGRYSRVPPAGYPHYRQSLPNENFNPQTPQIAPDFQFRGVSPDLPTSSAPQIYDERSPEFRQPPHSTGYRPCGPQGFAPIMSPFEHKPGGGGGGPQMFGPGMDFRSQGPRGMDFGPRGNRHQFRPFNPNGVRPNFRPNMPRMPPRLDGMRAPFGSQASSSFPAPPRPLQSYPGPQNHMTMSQQPPPQPQSKLPRKVLINPNFKGGVEAATTQLMMDTLQHPQFINSISSHVSHLHSDEELLRQQEEFITKNRMHIEKRRQERSPERERDRDYLSPPPRRERRASSRERGRGGWRSRRGDSREPERGGEWRRRKRSASPDRGKGDDKRERQEDDEDEETRAYRIEIEKQKAMREKILRDKEMRRRKAAEEKAKFEQQQQQTTEKKPQEAQPAQKLTPLVVTESKIISLKRKADPPNPQPVAAKQPATNSAAAPAKVPEPLPDYLDDDVATPSPPPPRTHTPPQPPTSSSVAPVQRRLVLKPAVDTQKVSLAFAADSTETTSKPKGIFDRLEKKISVPEATKRKIQRIVINNMDVKRTKVLILGRNDEEKSKIRK
ncbi:serine/arginine repetitive matrix protein 1 isoform X2 [Phlebotomus papatasi]|uniref:serine/arginine repetitive matrix protein 1 isoform X2 n=1 Tax=Phlebotomus papatasi TaxID=29031 RepID=UPI00248385E9|nr:serine/arginine repetitive matrix protein 1 isoform X2 [Phlebotomus papatasi]